MKRLIVAVLMFGGISCGGVEQVPAGDPSEPTTSGPESDDALSPQAHDPGVIKPHFIQCTEDQQCLTPQACAVFGGTSGGPFCSSGGRVCCTL